MSTIPQIATALQEVLTSIAHDLGRTTGFVQRQVKLDGASFTQILLFSYLANPDATLDELTQTAASIDISISAPGLDQRFTPQAAELLQQVLAAALKRLLKDQSPWDLPILSQFSQVFVEDGTLIELPAELAHLWSGITGSTGKQRAALKLMLRLDLLTGLIETLTLHPGRAHDSRVAPPSSSLPALSLSLSDLGFFRLTRLAEIAEQNAFFLTRFKLHTIIWDAHARRWDDVVALLEAQASERVDLPVTLGAKREVQGRLVAVALAQEVVDQRRRRLREQARRARRPVSAAQLAACAWSIYFTNVPSERLSVEAIMVVARVRWQVELVFKSWKSQGKIDQSRSGKVWRVMSDVYAKLLAMVVSHWVSLTEIWGYPDRSLVKAVTAIQKYALSLIQDVFGYYHQGLCETLRRIARVLASSCRMTRRKTKPNTYQLLQEVFENPLP